MLLLKNKVENGETTVKVEVEKVAEDFLMVSIINDISDSSRVPSYWRLLGRGVNPPLEIGINTKINTIKSITFFVDSDCFINLSIQELSTINGIIIVDTTIFKKENDFVDIAGEYFVSVSDNNLICVFGSPSYLKEVVGNNGIKFLVNQSNEVSGFIIYNLNEMDMMKIRSIIQ